MCYFLGSLELQMPCFGVFCVGGLASPGAEDQDSDRRWSHWVIYLDYDGPGWYWTHEKGPSAGYEGHPQ